MGGIGFCFPPPGKFTQGFEKIPLTGLLFKIGTDDKRSRNCPAAAGANHPPKETAGMSFHCGRNSRDELRQSLTTSPHPEQHCLFEPISVVDLNNEFQELKLSVRDEKDGSWPELSQKIGIEADAILRVIFSLAKLDLALMCARYAEDTHSVEPVLVPFSPETGTHPGSINPHPPGPPSVAGCRESSAYRPSA